MGAAGREGHPAELSLWRRLGVSWTDVGRAWLERVDPDRARTAAGALAEVPMPGGFRVDPVPGSIATAEAQEALVLGAGAIALEWFGRGKLDGTLRERGRVAAILGAEAALRRRDLALELALTTDKPADEAIAELAAAPRPHEAPEEPASAGAMTAGLVDQLRMALQPLRQNTAAFPFVAASASSSHTIALTKSQILAANEAILAADRALAEAGAT